MVGLIGVAIGVGVVGMYALDYHSHQCDGCKHTWRHLGAFNKGDHDAHTCPSCGQLQRWKNIAKDGAVKAEGNRLT